MKHLRALYAEAGSSYAEGGLTIAIRFLSLFPDWWDVSSLSAYFALKDEKN